jgi:hypothetical protein
MSGKSSRLLMLSACASALAACGTSSLVPVDRQPSAALLLPCTDPELVPDPESASAEQINVERINVARAYADCRQKHGDLATFVKAGAVRR